MPHIDDPCDANDEWEKRARRAMAWYDMVARLDPTGYVHRYIDAMIRNELIIIEPKRRGGNSYVERGDMITYRAHAANKNAISAIPDNRRFFIDESHHFVGIDHADGPDRSVISMDGYQFVFNGREYFPTTPTPSEYDGFKPETLHRMLTDQAYKDKTLAMRRKVDRRFDLQQPPEWKGRRPR